MIWDRDYMKRQADQPSATDPQSSPPPKPEPFNIFAGLEPEPLKPGEPIQPKSPPKSHSGPITQSASNPPQPPQTKIWLYIAIIIVALLIGIAIGSGFLR